MRLFAVQFNCRFRVRAERSPHGLRHLRPDLKAAAADARADGRMNVLRRAAEFRLHPKDGLVRDALRRSAPPGVDGGDGLPHGVKQQQRRAVRTEADERRAGLVGQKPVADGGLLPLQPCAAVLLADAQQKIGMLLPGKDRFLRRKANGGAENAVILPHVFRPVSPVRAEIEGGQRPLAHAAEARGEAVHAPGKRVGGQIFKCSVVNGVKHGLNSRSGRVRRRDPCRGSIFCIFFRCRTGTGRSGRP